MSSIEESDKSSQLQDNSLGNDHEGTDINSIIHWFGYGACEY